MATVYFAYNGRQYSVVVNVGGLDTLLDVIDFYFGIKVHVHYHRH